MAKLVKVVQETSNHHIFAPEAFSHQVGETVPLTTADGRQIDNCKVVSIEVSEDGSSATCTFEVPDELFPTPPMSIDED